MSEYANYKVQEVDSIIHNTDTNLWSAILLVKDSNADERFISINDSIWENFISIITEMGLMIKKDDLIPLFDTHKTEQDIGSNDNYYTVRSNANE